MTNAINPSLFYFLQIQSQNKSDSNIPSGLEIAFILDNGASIFVHKI